MHSFSSDLLLYTALCWSITLNVVVTVRQKCEKVQRVWKNVQGTVFRLCYVQSFTVFALYHFEHILMQQFCLNTFIFYIFCPFCAWLVSQIIKSINGLFTHPFRLLRMEAMPMTMLATDRALAAFFRANSLMWCPVAWSLRRSLLAYWKKSESKQQWQLVAVRVE